MAELGDEGIDDHGAEDDHEDAERPQRRAGAGTKRRAGQGADRRRRPDRAPRAWLLVAVARPGAGEPAARIANAAAGSSHSKVGRKGGKSGAYDDWSKQDLVQQAREIGVRGRSTMTKAEMVKALRDH